MYILFAILGFGLLVLIHEFGHFAVARLNGIKVIEFAIGMGPKLFSVKGKETTYSIRALPIGGLCQMKGESTGEEDLSSDSFQSKKPLQRMSVIFAGPFMNLVLGLVIFFGLGLSQGYATNTVREISPGTPAVTAGLKAGDRIAAIDGKKTPSFNDVVYTLLETQDKPLKLSVLRGTQTVELNVTPQKSEAGNYIIGFYPEIVEKPTILQAMSNGYYEARSLARVTITSLKMLLTGKAQLSQVSGPVAIIGVATQAAKTNILSFIRLLGFITINLAVFNLLPFPALDGGWLLVLLFELLTGRKPSEKFMIIWNNTGFVLLMALMVLVTFKDIFFPTAM